jgi:UDP-N-acetylmuramoyl-tripeptide--D-alanyl-D-alanine ligase
VRFNLNGNHRRRVFVPMLGKHTACNALAAIAVGRKMGLAVEAIIDSLSRAHGPDMRLQLSKVNGVTVLNDAYNANPNSTRAAIETLDRPAQPARPARRGAGRHARIGQHSDHYHAETGRTRGQERP